VRSGFHQRAPQLVHAVGAHAVAPAPGGFVGHLQPLQRDRVSLADLARQVVGAEHQLVRRCHHAARRHRHVEVVDGFGGVGGEPVAAAFGIVQHDQRVVGKEVEHGLERRLQQRRQRLDTGRRAAPQE
jgi:hypothetical protein